MGKKAQIFKKLSSRTKGFFIQVCQGDADVSTYIGKPGLKISSKRISL